MNPDPTDALRQSLTTQLRLATELEQLLAEERARMTARDWEAVLRLSERKTQLVAQLQAASRPGAAPGSPALRAAAASAGLDTLHDELARCAERLLRANRACRALLDHHQTRVDTALQLMNRGPAAGIYGPAGRRATGRVSQRLAAA